MSELNTALTNMIEILERVERTHLQGDAIPTHESSANAWSRLLAQLEGGYELPAKEKFDWYLGANRQLELCAIAVNSLSNVPPEDLNEATEAQVEWKEAYNVSWELCNALLQAMKL